MKISKMKLSVLMAGKMLNVKSLSELSGVSRQTVSAIKNGKSCSIVTVGKLAAALGVDVIDLIDDKELY